MNKKMKLFIVLAMLSIPALVHFGVALRIRRLDLYSDNYVFMKDLMSWQEPIAKGFFDYFWQNFIYYLSPHLSVIIFASIFHWRFSLTARALAVINIVLILFSIFIYGRPYIPDPMVWLYYLLAEAVCLSIFFICIRFLTQKDKGST